MGKNHKKIKEILPLMINQFEKNNLTLKEVADTSKVDVNFIEALLDENNPILENLTKLLDFANIKSSFRVYSIESYISRDCGEYVSIIRNIEPVCSIKFDKTQQKYYDLTPLKKHQILTITQKRNILYDFIKYRENKLQ